jgi:aminopeptidase N
MQRASTTSLKSTYFQALRSVALTDAGVRKLERVWRKELAIPHLPFSEQDFMKMALELAVREVPGWSDILNEQLARIQDPERKARFEFVMPAVSADPTIRDAFFASLAKVENRRHEPWVLEGVAYLHHPLRAEQSEKYILPSLELVQEIQRTGDIFFPKRWLDATLDGHNSERAAAIVRQFLADHPTYPPRLKGKILQAADGLFRAAATVKP